MATDTMRRSRRTSKPTRFFHCQETDKEKEKPTTKNGTNIKKRRSTSREKASSKSNKSTTTTTTTTTSPKRRKHEQKGKDGAPVVKKITTTTTPAPPTCRLGLLPLVDRGEVSMTRVIPLQEGNILGRNPMSYSVKKSPDKFQNHVNLGITKDHGCEKISRNFLHVIQVTAHQIVLRVPPKVTNASYLDSTTFLSVKRNSQPTPEPLFSKNNTSSDAVLHAGDILSIRNDTHTFQVVACPESPLVPPATVSDTSSAIIDNDDNDEDVKENSENGATIRTIMTSSSSNKTSLQDNKNKQSSTIPRSSLPRNKKNDGIPPTTKDLAKEKNESLSFVPFRPPLAFGVGLPPKPRTTMEPTTLLPKNATEKQHSPAKVKMGLDSDGEDDDEDDDDDEDGKNGPQEMHVSFANAYWKALNSNMPHMGAGFLNLLLLDGQLPTKKLLTDLVDLVTFGPRTQGYAFWDGHRMQVTLEYLKSLLHRHPTRMRHALAQAAGPDFWRTVLEQLTTVHYLAEDYIGRFSSSDMENDEKEDPRLQEQALLDSLQLHCGSLELLELLLQNDETTMMDDCEESSRGVMWRYMEDYGAKAVCRLAAHSLAQVWIQHGHYLFSTAENPSLSSAVQNMTQRLGRIVVTLLQNLLTPFSQGDTLNLLWDAMGTQLAEASANNKKSHNNHKKSKITKGEHTQLKLFWICSLPREWQTALVKRAGVVQPYRELRQGL